MKYHFIFYILIFVFCSSISTTSFAKNSVGSLRNVSGLATIRRIEDGKRRTIQARNGLHIYQKDTIKTTFGTLGIIFNDSTRISLAKNSTLIVTKYVYSPGKKQYGMITRVMKGKSAVFTGQISNLAADSMVFKTPNAIIRSKKNTNFLIEVNNKGES